MVITYCLQGKVKKKWHCKFSFQITYHIWAKEISVHSFSSTSYCPFYEHDGLCWFNIKLTDFKICKIQCLKTKFNTQNICFPELSTRPTKRMHLPTNGDNNN